MFHKKFNQDLINYNFFKQKMYSCETKKFASVLNYLNIFKAVHINDPQTHSPQQNKKAKLTAAAYFKVYTPVRSQRQ